MARGLVALVSALIVLGFLWQLTLTTAACTTAPVDAGACDASAGLCSSNEDCGRVPCDGGPDSGCPRHCTLGGIDTSGNPLFCCAPGPPPGTGDAGAPCEGPDDCASGRCVNTTTFNVTVCSAPCSSSADCPPVLSACIFFDGGALVTTPLPLDAGAFCGLPASAMQMP